MHVFVSFACIDLSVTRLMKLPNQLFHVRHPFVLIEAVSSRRCVTEVVAPRQMFQMFHAMLNWGLTHLHLRWSSYAKHSELCCELPIHIIRIPIHAKAISQAHLTLTMLL